MHQKRGYQHIESKNSCGKTCAESYQDEERSHNFAHENTIGKKFGKSQTCNYAFDKIYARELSNTMQQHEQRKTSTEDKKSQIRTRE